MALPTDYIVGDTRSISGAMNAANQGVNRATEGTGWRNVAGSLLNGWTAEICKIRKVGSRVDVFFDLNGTAATSNTMFSFGADWGADRTAGAFYSLPSFDSAGAPSSTGVRVTSAGQFSSANRSSSLRCMISFPANANYPASLPGVAA